MLHCPECPKTFLCKSGLASHIETHPSLSTHCSLCDITFRNPRKLQLHKLIAHTETEKIKWATSEEGLENLEEGGPKVGFDDLSFVDFSTEKFPLIAKHFFEKNPRQSSSAYLNFMCRLCSKSFPCESSLILHTYSHSKDKCTTCPLCDCDYADLSDFHSHILKHLSDKAFEAARPSISDDNDEDDDIPDKLSKHDFLAMLSLKEDEEKVDQNQTKQALLSPVKKEPVKPAKMEKLQNNEYFAKLGQAYAAGVPPLFGQFPMFPPGYQPTLDDFHKMLQIATNMNMLPSMGPNFLGLKGFPAVSSQNQTSSLTSPSRSSLAGSQSSPGNQSTSKLSPMYGSQPNASSSGRGETRNFPGQEREINNARRGSDSGSSYSCKYCDRSFSDYKTLKSKYQL